MEIIGSIVKMRQKSGEWIRSGKRIAFVPTMGFFHEGHLELMREAGRRADILVVSIFVNPIQFGPAEDYDTYPRDMEGDRTKAENTGVDVLYTPSASEMYPDGFQTRVSVGRITQHLCGLSRPGHFEGVTTVVAKLFNAVRPHVALFGRKDFQQFMVIRRMVEDLDMDIDVIGVPTVREPDGLAMSSRNKYLNPDERRSALSIKKSMDSAAVMVSEGEKDSGRIISAIRKLILDHPYTRIDYIRICDPVTMEDKDTVRGETLLALAVYVGGTRLIDNCLLNNS